MCKDYSENNYYIVCGDNMNIFWLIPQENYLSNKFEEFGMKNYKTMLTTIF